LPTPAAETLRVQLEKFAGIVNISADAIICVDQSLRITDFNLGAEHIFGYRAEEVIGQPLDLLIPPRFRESHRGHMRRFGEGNIAARRMGERREISALRKGGEEFRADGSISKLDVAGERVYTIVLRDITAQKRAESVQRFLAQAGTLLVASLDQQTTYRSIARLATEFIADCCVIFDVSQTGSITRAAVAVSDPALEDQVAPWQDQPVRPGSAHPVINVVAQGIPVLLSDVATFVAGADAADKDVELWSGLPVHSAMLLPLVARSRTLGAIGFYRTAAMPRFTADDLTFAEELAVGCALAVDNARLYHAAEAAVRARDDVLAVVSHDLGNPLSAIRIGTTLLLRAMGPDRPLGGGWEHLAGIKQSVEQMERLIRDLLEVKRIEAGQLALDARPVRPTALVANVVEMMAPLAEGKSIAIEAHVAHSLPLVSADGVRVVQALSNLVGNAVKFTHAGGRVEIRAQLAKHEVIFSVIDDGPGIDADDLDRIFDRFWQARRSRDTGGGLGLGLAIVKGIVHAHGGRVWAESQPGRGTAIHFTLPLAADGATAAA
jgi:PAS domain S-box-containing protein